MKVDTTEALFLGQDCCLGGVPRTGPGVFAREADENESPTPGVQSIQLSRLCRRQIALTLAA